MFVKVASPAFSGAGFDFLDYSDNGLPLEIGDLVVVPFNNRYVTGFIINTTFKTEIKDVLPVYQKIENGNSLTPELIDLAVYVSKTYFCPLSRVILSVIPSSLTNKVKEFYTISKDENTFFTPKESEIIDRIDNGKGVIGKLDTGEKRVLRSLIKKNILSRNFVIDKPKALPKMIKTVSLTGATLLKPTEKQQILIDFLKDKDLIPVSYLTKNKIASASIINTLIIKKILKSEEIREDRIPPYTYISHSNVELTEGQQNAFDSISQSIEENKKDVFLLFGVTASGKTEVYMRLIEKVITKGKSAIILLPEIAITTQVMNIFKSKFGKLVAVLHSGLSAGERLDEWDRISKGEVKIVVGARSAVFAPIKNIGIIIIDEEHDSGYKQDINPKYETKELAKYRAEKNNAVCVFGSATPSVESYYKTTTGEYKLVTMSERVSGRKLPTVYMSDLKGMKSDVVISDILGKKIKERLDRKEQIIILQNRRAYSTYITCPDCAWVAKCVNCDVSLKFHYKSNMLLCHHCGYALPKPLECPDCHNKYLKAYGTGTQKVEELLKYHFPQARILRMDRDSTQGKYALQNILNAFRNREADILVGTQMVAKGLDFPFVTLVGVVNADMELNMPDFRSGERTFQLINQVTGRAGRGDTEGEVVIQTFNPDNQILKFAKAQDYISLFNSEIKDRKELNYPPFVRIIKATVQGEKLNDLKNLLAKFHADLIKINNQSDKMEIYPPLPALIPKINNIYKVNMLVKTTDMDYAKKIIISLINLNMNYKRNINFDIDPMFLD